GRRRLPQESPARPRRRRAPRLQRHQLADQHAPALRPRRRPPGAALADQPRPRDPGAGQPARHHRGGRRRGRRPRPRRRGAGMSASDGSAPAPAGTQAITAGPGGPPPLRGQAVVSFVLGVLGLVPYTFGLAALPAVWLGYRAVYAVNASDGRLRGRGLGKAGLALGLVGLGVVAVWVVVIIAARLNATSARA